MQPLRNLNPTDPGLCACSALSLVLQSNKFSASEEPSMIVNTALSHQSPHSRLPRLRFTVLSHGHSPANSLRQPPPPGSTLPPLHPHSCAFLQNPLILMMGFLLSWQAQISSGHSPQTGMFFSGISTSHLLQNYCSPLSSNFPPCSSPHS